MSNAPISQSFKEGMTATRSGHRLLARLHFAEAINEQPSVDSHWLWMAWVAESPAAAVSHLHKALECNPDNEIARAGLVWARVMAEWDFEKESTPRATLRAVAERELPLPPPPVSSTPVLTPSIDDLIKERPARPEDSMIFSKHQETWDHSSETNQPAEPAKKQSVPLAEELLTDQSTEPVTPSASQSNEVSPKLEVSIEEHPESERSQPQQVLEESALDVSVVSGDLVPKSLSDSLFDELLDSNAKSEVEEVLAAQGLAPPSAPTQVEVEATPEPVVEEVQIPAQEPVVFAEPAEPTDRPEPAPVVTAQETHQPDRAESLPIDAITGSFVGKTGALKLDSFEGFKIEAEHIEKADPYTTLTGTDPVTSNAEIDLDALPAATAEPQQPTAHSETAASPSNNDIMNKGVGDSGFELVTDESAEAAALNQASTERPPSNADISLGSLASSSEVSSRDFVELTQSAVDFEMSSKNDINLDTSGARRILIVDDSPTVCKIVSITLKKRGFKVSTAADGVEAMAMISADRPDLILLDINMPRMDGYQLCKLIKGYPETKDIPVVMLSGKDGFFDRVRGKLVGCSDYITKPFDPEQLVATVEQYVSRSVPLAR
jgi:twitching motility two-component system response regulator PilG